MSIGLLVVVALVLFAVLLTLGHRQLAAGANLQTANGAALMALATVLGVAAIGSLGMNV
ncbi:hypothetical protein GCM10027425_01820 [Alteromonas gracilis]